MADVSATINYYGYPKGNDNTQRNQIRRGTIALTPTNGTYPVGGIPLNWSSEGNKSIPFSGSSTIMPLDVDFKSVSKTDGIGGVGTGPSGYIYLWDSVQGNLHIFTSMAYGAVSSTSGPLVEVGGNVPWGVFTDTIQFTATFSRND